MAEVYQPFSRSACGSLSALMMDNNEKGSRAGPVTISSERKIWVGWMLRKSRVLDACSMLAE